MCGGLYSKYQITCLTPTGVVFVSDVCVLVSVSESKMCSGRFQVGGHVGLSDAKRKMPGLP